MSDEERKLREAVCLTVRAAIQDEEDAARSYESLGKMLQESDTPGVRVIGETSVWQIEQDERKHKEALARINRLICSTLV